FVGPYAVAEKLSSATVTSLAAPSPGLRFRPMCRCAGFGADAESIACHAPSARYHVVTIPFTRLIRREPVVPEAFTDMNRGSMIDPYVSCVAPFDMNRSTTALAKIAPRPT